MVQNAIIVPTYNRPEQLAQCLKSLIVQENDDFEIIVVDDGSPEPVSDTCARFGDRVRCIRQENSGPAIARNTGANCTEARFLAFTDDDCQPRPDWLSRLVTAHAGCDDRMVGGLVVNGLTDDRYACASQAICDYLYSYYGASDGRMPFFTSNNIALSRSGFMRLGGFDPSFVRAAAEDRDFGLRWRETGGELVYAEDAIIDHFHGMSFAAFWRQHTNYGAGAVNLHNMMRQRGIMRKEFEPASFYLGLVSWPLRKYGPRRLDLSILIALSQIAMVNGYFLKARQNERHSIAA